MLTSIELEKYRGFKSYRIGGLTRVNLLVGKNGCGKTSLLEALYLLLSRDKPAALEEIAVSWRREFAAFEGPGGEPAFPPDLPSAVHFFRGHQVQAGDFLRIGSERGGEPCELRLVAIPPAEVPNPRVVPWYLSHTRTVPALALLFEGPASAGAVQAPTILLSNTGALIRPPSGVQEPIAPKADIRTSVHFVSPGHPPFRLKLMWEKVLRKRRDDEIMTALRILEPRISDIAFGSGGMYVDDILSGVFVALEGMPERVPLGSLGDGFRQLLFLAILLVQSDGDVLLVDEIDTGLHYSVMGDIWRFVAEVAKRSDTQVFATTHSLDCVRGLAWLCEVYPDLRGEVSLQKIAPSLDRAVAFDAEKITIAAEQEIELR